MLLGSVHRSPTSPRLRRTLPLINLPGFVCIQKALLRSPLCSELRRAKVELGIAAKAAELGLPVTALRIVEVVVIGDPNYPKDRWRERYTAN